MTPGADAPVRLRLAPLAVLFILVLTAVPLELRSFAAWDMVIARRDIVQNLLLFVPLGFAVRGWPLARVALVAFGLSSFVELTQLWSVGRFASPVDVASNTAGALLAAVVMRRFAARAGGRPAAIRLSMLTGGPILLFAGGILILWSDPLPPSDLSLWDPSFRLHVGNEGSRDRGWRGTISDLEFRAPATGTGSSPMARPIAGPLTFDGTGLDTLATSVGQALFAATRQQSTFAIRAVIAPAFIHHEEFPTTIVSYSLDSQARNFALEQHDVRLVFRVTTPTTTPSGSRARVISSPVLELGREAEVLATFDGTVARIMVDGRLVGRSNLAAAGCANTQICDIAAPAAWATIGAALALLVLLIAPSAALAGDLVRVNVAAATAVVGTVLLPAFPVAAGAYRHLPLVALVAASFVAGARVRERDGTA